MVKKYGEIGERFSCETSSSDEMGFKNLVFMRVASKFV